MPYDDNRGESFRVSPEMRAQFVEFLFGGLILWRGLGGGVVYTRQTVLHFAHSVRYTYPGTSLDLPLSRGVEFIAWD